VRRLSLYFRNGRIPTIHRMFTAANENQCRAVS
jgi:hypothetical protein